MTVCETSQPRGNAKALLIIVGLLILGPMGCTYAVMTPSAAERAEHQAWLAQREANNAAASEYVIWAAASDREAKADFQ